MPVGQELVFQSLLDDWEEYKFTPHYHYFCSVEIGLQTTYTVPDSIRLESLTVDHVTEVNEHLPYKSSTSAGYIRHMIEFLPSIGAFNKDTGELMGWILTYMNECHSALTVKQKYQGKGLGKLLTKKLMKDRALVNKPSHCNIRCGNVVSERIFTGLGFVRGEKVLFGGKNGRII